MDNFIEFSVSDWGITFSSAPLYFNLSWGLIILAFGLVIARKIIKARRG
jgi:hypothetical protein